MSTTAGFDFVSEMSPSLIASILLQIEMGGPAGMPLTGLGVTGADSMTFAFPMAGQQQAAQFNVTILPPNSTTPPNQVTANISGGPATYFPANAPQLSLAVTWSVNFSFTVAQTPPSGAPPTSAASLQPALVPNSASFPSQVISADVLTAAGQDNATFVAAVQASLSAAVNSAASTTLTSIPIGAFNSDPRKGSLGPPIVFFGPPVVICVTGSQQTSLAILGLLIPSNQPVNAADYKTSNIPPPVPNMPVANSCIVLSQRAFNKFMICGLTSPAMLVAGTCNGTGTTTLGTSGLQLINFQSNFVPGAISIAATVTISEPCVTATAVYTGPIVPSITQGQLQLTGTLTQQSISTDISFWCILASVATGLPFGLVLGDVGFNAIADVLLDAFGSVIVSAIAPSSVSSSQLKLPPLPAFSDVTVLSISIPNAADAVVIGASSTGLPDPPAVIGTPLGSISMGISSSSKVTGVQRLPSPQGGPVVPPPATETLTEWIFNVNVFEVGFASNVSVAFFAQQGSGPVTPLQNGTVKIPVETVYATGSGIGSVLIDVTLGVVIGQTTSNTASLTLTTLPADGNYSFTLIARSVLGAATLAEKSVLITVKGQSIQTLLSSSSAASINSALNTLRQIVATEITAGLTLGPGPGPGPGPLLGDGSDPELLQAALQALLVTGTPAAESTIAVLQSLYGVQLNAVLALSPQISRTSSSS
jgi:hypothetical protein